MKRVKKGFCTNFYHPNDIIGRKSGPFFCCTSQSGSTEFLEPETGLKILSGVDRPCGPKRGEKGFSAAVGMPLVNKRPVSVFVAYRSEKI